MYGPRMLLKAGISGLTLVMCGAHVRGRLTSPGFMQAGLGESFCSWVKGPDFPGLRIFFPFFFACKGKKGRDRSESIFSYIVKLLALSL